MNADFLTSIGRARVITYGAAGDLSSLYGDHILYESIVHLTVFSTWGGYQTQDEVL